MYKAFQNFMRNGQYYSRTQNNISRLGLTPSNVGRATARLLNHVESGLIDGIGLDPVTARLAESIRGPQRALYARQWGRTDAVNQ